MDLEELSKYKKADLLEYIHGEGFVANSGESKKELHDKAVRIFNKDTAGIRRRGLAVKKEVAAINPESTEFPITMKKDDYKKILIDKYGYTESQVAGESKAYLRGLLFFNVQGRGKPKDESDSESDEEPEPPKAAPSALSIIRNPPAKLREDVRRIFETVNAAPAAMKAKVFAAEIAKLDPAQRKLVVEGIKIATELKGKSMGK